MILTLLNNRDKKDNRERLFAIHARLDEIVEIGMHTDKL